MARKVHVHPIFYARLQLALMDLQDALDAEIEFVGRHLSTIEKTFAQQWDQLPGPDDWRVRWVDGRFKTIPALFVVVGRLSDANVIELRSIRIVVDPEPY